MAAQKGKIEFLPQEEWEKKPIGKFLKWALTIGRHLVIATEFIVILAFISRFKLDRDVADLNEEIKRQQAIINSSTQFEQEFRFLQKRINTIESSKKDQLEADRALLEIANLTPIDVSFSDFGVNKKEVSLTATALSEAGLATFLKKLNSSPLFENLSVPQITAGETKGIGISFELRGSFKKN